MSSLLVRHGRWGSTGTCFNHCWTQSELLGTRTLPMVWHRIMPHRCTERRKRKKQKMTFFFPIFCTQHGQPLQMIKRDSARVGINIAIMTSHMRRQQAEAGSQQVSEHELSKDNEYLSACVRQHFSCACWISPAKKTAFCNCDHVEWAVVWVWMVVRLIGRDMAHIAKWYRRNGLPWASSSTYLGLPRRAASSL